MAKKGIYLVARMCNHHFHGKWENVGRRTLEQSLQSMQEPCIISTLVPKQLLKSPKPLVINPGAFCVAGVREADRSLVTKSNYKAKEKNKVHRKVHRKVIIERLSYVLFLEVCMFSTSIDFPSNLTIYFDDHYYSCYHVPKIKRVLFHYIEGCGSVTMETAHMKFVFLVSASYVLSYAT
jgi:hypothetical protein